MKIELSNPPRIFHIPLPNGERITLSDCAHITLGVDEQITLFTDNGNEYDITRKDWGYYATPSLNRRLAHFHLRAVLVRGLNDTFFINLVEQGHEENFQQYLDYHNIRVVAWLDTLEALEHLEALMLSNQYSPQLEITRFAQAYLGKGTHSLLEIKSQFEELSADSFSRKGYVVSKSSNPPVSYEIPIEELDLSTRAFNSLRRAGITSIGDVLDMLVQGTDAMLTIQNFGVNSLNELIIRLQYNGYLAKTELGASLEQRGWTVSHLQNVDAPIPEHPYDVVCFNQVLRNDDESRHLLKGAHRFLRQGGFVFVAVSTDTPYAFSITTFALMAELTEWEIIRIERQQNILFAFLVHKES